MKLVATTICGALLSLATVCAAEAGTGTLVAEPPAGPVRDGGPLAANTVIHLGFSLNYRHDSELEALIRAQSTPGSPQYAHFLTPAQFRDYFAPTRAEVGTFLATLRSRGYVVTATSPTRTFVDAQAPAAIVQRDFSTALHHVTDARGTRGYANVAPAYLPAQFGNVVFSVAGLNGLPIARPAYEIARRAGSIAPSGIGPPYFGPDFGFGPAVFLRAYDAPFEHVVPGGPAGARYDGTGRAAATVIDADYADSDLSGFLAYFHIKRTAPPIVRVKVDGGAPIFTPDGVEAALDVETIAGASPGAALYEYQIPQLQDVNIEDAYSRIVSDDLVDAVNSSFGGCEASQFAGAPQAENHIARQGNAEGITFAAASGDEAATAFGCEPAVAVDAPASAPHFTGVGGTALAVTPGIEYAVEQGWYAFDPFRGVYVGSGGGVSQIFERPAYQRGIANILQTGRNVPDVAFSGSGSSGQSFYYQGIFQGPAGGTSLASALFTAYAAQLAQVTGHRLGNINEAMYGAFRDRGYGKPEQLRFHDVTTGGNPTWPAVPGYDRETGIGSLQLWHFAHVLH